MEPTPRYEKFTLKELQDVARHIDKDAEPDKHQQVMALMRNREADLEQADRLYNSRFMGWLPAIYLGCLVAIVLRGTAITGSQVVSTLVTSFLAFGALIVGLVVLMAMLAISLIEFMGPLLVLASALLLFVGLPLWCISDCANSPSLSENKKFGWILLIVVTNYFGSLAYAFWVADLRSIKRTAAWSMLAFPFALFAVLAIFFMGARPKKGTPTVAPSGLPARSSTVAVQPKAPSKLRTNEK